MRFSMRLSFRWYSMLWFIIWIFRMLLVRKAFIFIFLIVWLMIILKLGPGVGLVRLVLLGFGKILEVIYNFKVLWNWIPFFNLGEPVACQGQLKWIRSFRNIHSLFVHYVPQRSEFPFQCKCNEFFWKFWTLVYSVFLLCFSGMQFYSALMFAWAVFCVHCLMDFTTIINQKDLFD